MRAYGVPESVPAVHGKLSFLRPEWHGDGADALDVLEGVTHLRRQQHPLPRRGVQDERVIT